jgi:hypothetical protein
MSAELWAAFGKGTEDLSSNPWSQPSPTEASSKIEHQKEESAIARRSEQTPIEKPSLKSPQSPWGAADVFSPVYRPQNTSSGVANDRWKILEQSNDDSWSDFANPEESTDPWAGTKSLGTTTSTWNISSTTQEDDFGDFEDPENDKVKDLDSFKLLSRSQKLTSDMNKPPQTKIEVSSQPATAYNRGDKLLPSKDPYGEIDSLTKPKKPTSQLKDIKSIHPPKYQPKRQTALVDELVPYTEEEWGDWSPDPITSPNFTNTKSKEAPQTTNLSEKHTRNPSEPSVKKTPRAPSKDRSRHTDTSIALPPSNVPPPSILISLVCGLIEKLPSQVETAMQNLTETETSSKALETALRKCLASLRVAARITAGRKLRWKRDIHLSQSMSIGPAGKSGGMKLSGVDKNEAKREDRESAEFVRIWKQKLGSIRKALASVNSRIAGTPLLLPDISETMLIRTLKQADGGLSSAKCCVLCGIKRDERVDKVDAGVFDSFGEWWVEHWGHTDCKNFWYEHERYLQQR